MAWIEKYYMNTEDADGNPWYVKIYKEDASTGSTELLPGGAPITFEIANESDDVFGGLKEIRAVLNVVSSVNFELKELYSYEDRTWLVKIYNADVTTPDVSTLYWQGFIDTQKYEEPYEDAKNEVAISCNTGIDILGDIEYKDASGNYYNGRKYASEIILDILDKIGFNTFSEYVNMYETRMADSSTDSPFDQVLIDVDVFKDLYCDDVLKQIMMNHNACITQVNGEFVIYRPIDLIQTSIPGRAFTDISTHTPISYSPYQYLNRPNHKTQWQTLTGGVMTIQPPAKEIKCTFDYGNKDSWVDNWDFDPETYHDDTSTWDFWTRTSSTLESVPLSYFVPTEDGIALRCDSNSNTFLKQTFAPYCVKTNNDLFVIEFDYGHYNPSTNDITGCYSAVYIEQGNYGLSEVDDKTCAWRRVAPSYIWFSNVTAKPGFSGWTSYKRTFSGLPLDTDISVGLKVIDKDGVYMCYKDVKFYCTSHKVVTSKKKRNFFQRIRISRGSGDEYQIDLRNKYYSVSQKEATENVVEKEYLPDMDAKHGKSFTYDFILGDVTDSNLNNVIEQFGGALGMYVDSSLYYTESWNSINDSSKNMLTIMGDEIANHYNVPKQFIQLPILELGPSMTSLNRIGNLIDEKNDDKPFAINRGTFDVRKRQWEVDLVELTQQEITIDTTTGAHSKIDDVYTSPQPGPVYYSRKHTDYITQDGMYNSTYVDISALIWTQYANVFNNYTENLDVSGYVNIISDSSVLLFNKTWARSIPPMHCNEVSTYYINVTNVSKDDFPLKVETYQKLYYAKDPPPNFPSVAYTGRGQTWIYDISINWASGTPAKIINNAANDTFYLEQSMYPAVSYWIQVTNVFILDTSKLSYEYDGDSTDKIIGVATCSPWFLSTSENWITPTVDSSSQVTVNVSVNSGNARDGSIWFGIDGSTTQRVVSIHQDSSLISELYWDYTPGTGSAQLMTDKLGGRTVDISLYLQANVMIDSYYGNTLSTDADITFSCDNPAYSGGQNAQASCDDQCGDNDEYTYSLKGITGSSNIVIEWILGNCEHSANGDVDPMVKANVTSFVAQGGGICEITYPQIQVQKDSACFEEIYVS